MTGRALCGEEKKMSRVPVAVTFWSYFLEEICHVRITLCACVRVEHPSFQRRESLTTLPPPPKKKTTLGKQLISRLSLPLCSLGVERSKIKFNSPIWSFSLTHTTFFKGSGTPPSLVIEPILPSQRSCQLTFSIGHYWEMLHDTLGWKKYHNLAQKILPDSRGKRQRELFSTPVKFNFFKKCTTERISDHKI